jgi:phosphatidylglycerophosphate synthase
VRSVQARVALGVLAEVALLGVLDTRIDLRIPGWLTGVACAVLVNAWLAGALVRSGTTRLGPADRVTLARATLVCAVAALTADALERPRPVPLLVALLVALSVVALVLDAVDGRVARRTGTVSAVGARFDGEVDALLILVLSVLVARSAGAWVLAIGAARYAFLAAGWVAPWMRGWLPPRYWRKVVAATQGIVLTCAVAGVLPTAAMATTLAVALALLAESFGRDVVWLWRRRPVPARAPVLVARASSERRRTLTPPARVPDRRRSRVVARAGRLDG